MAGPHVILDTTYQASSAVDQYAVLIHDTGQVGYAKLPTASGDAAVVGVTQDSASASGDTIRVRKIGISKVIAAAALSAGDQVWSGNTNGRVNKPTTWSDGKGIVGEMEEAATASGDIVRCFLTVGTTR